MKSNSPRYHYTSSGTPITMSTTPRHFSFDHHAPSTMCTPTIKEESALSTSSGTPSADSCFKSSPRYLAMSYDNAVISSPRQISYFQYDRDEGGVSQPYPYHLSQNFQTGTSLASLPGFRSASSSTTTNASSSSSTSSSSQNYNNYLSTLPAPQQFSLVSSDTPISTHQHNPSSPPPSSFLHQQSYMIQPYPNSTSDYCSNMLGLSTSEEEGVSYTYADQIRSTPTQPFPQNIPQQQYNHYNHSSSELLDHHRQQPQENQASFFSNPNPVVSFVNSNADTPFEAKAI